MQDIGEQQSASREKDACIVIHVLQGDVGKKSLQQWPFRSDEVYRLLSLLSIYE